MTKVFQLALFFLMLWTSIIFAGVNVEITKGVNIAKPIAVVPFKWMGTRIAKEDISKIVSEDLRNSGKFNPIKIEQIPKKQNILSTLTSEPWTQLNVDIVVVGQVQACIDGSYIIFYKLIDAASSPGRILIQKKLSVTKKLFRYAAHTISDEVFEKLIGTKGVFRTRIAYIVQACRKKLPYELRVADYDGYDQFILHRSNEPLMSPAWSPDGTQIAYVTFESGRSSLVIQNLVNGVIRPIASFPRHNGSPAFSPDGRYLAFSLSKSGSLNLYLINLNSDQIIQVTKSRSNNTEPAWFPDSKSLIYTSDQGGRPQIYKININGGRPHRLTWDNHQNQNAQISSDGKFLVIVASNDAAQHISKLDIESGAIQILTKTLLDETPSLAPNGTMLIYSSTKNSGSVIQLASTDGRFTMSLPSAEGQAKFPSWSPYL